MRKLLVKVIDIYQIFISPIIPSCCRFYPTCSTYFKEAVIKYGLIKGPYLGIKRIIKCHPCNPGGVDLLE